MYKAIHRPNRIAGAQNRLLRRIRKELPTRLHNVAVGFQGDSFKLSEVIANNAIWFAHQSLENEKIPRNWNALGAGLPVLRRSNNITVEVNVALHRVDKGVAGLFALDEETGSIALLHRGRIGGGKRGVGQASFMEWYSGRKVSYFDPSRDDEEGTAILVADLGSSEFLSDVESFVDAVHRFKASLTHDDPGQLSDSEIRNKAAAAPARPRSSTTAAVIYARNPHVAEFAKRRARGKCELCKRPAPFDKAPNEPYLESHHIVWLSRGGTDRPENTVALCPNCHRKMHVVNDSKDVKTLQRRAKAALRG